MVKFKDINDLLTFLKSLKSNGFEEIADNVTTFINLHPCSEDVVEFEVEFTTKPKVYAIIRIDIEKWVEELTSDN